MSRERCQCTPTCRFLAEEGQPFKLEHDPRDEFAEARTALVSAKGRLGGLQTQENHRAAACEDAESVDLRTVDGRLDAVNRAARRVMERPIEPAKIAQAIAALARVADEIHRTARLEAENRELRAIIESNPDLKRKLKAVS